MHLFITRSKTYAKKEPEQKTLTNFLHESSLFGGMQFPRFIVQDVQSCILTWLF
jgi:hypothetical protein